ncbi:MAG: GtrA family protein [Firmicutes bacterium]|nr:GtrA family protein [Bacillota bacterium]
MRKLSPRLVSIAEKLVNRETLHYLFWGLLTSAYNIGVFQLLLWLGVDYRPANLFAVITGKIITYLTSKFFVFQTHCESRKALAREIGRYTLDRGVTMFVDYFGLIALTNWLSINPAIGKYITAAVVMVLNYVLGKFHAFRKQALAA